MDKQELEDFVSKNYSTRRISKETGKGQSTIRYWLDKYGLKTNKLAFKEQSRIINSPVNTSSNEELQKLLDENTSVSSILRQLNVRASCGHSRDVIKKRMKELDCSTFNSNRTIVSPFVSGCKVYEDEELFVVDGTAGNGTVRCRLKRVRPQTKCEVCNASTLWFGKPLILQMDHINGNNKDNRLENLRWICPNCHSQTETYTGKNKTKDKTPN